MSKRVSLSNMRSARRVGLRSAVLLGASAFLAGLGLLPSCQFPDYDFVPPGNGQAGTAAEAGAPAGGASTGGMGGMVTDGGAAGVRGVARSISISPKHQRAVRSSPNKPNPSVRLRRPDETLICRAYRLLQPWNVFPHGLLEF
jgi:hypothetical protein